MDEEDNYPLLRTVWAGDVSALASFLQQNPGVDVDCLFETGKTGKTPSTPLNWAIHHNHKAIVEVLLDHGAAVNGPRGAYMTPLQVACAEDWVDAGIVKLLIDHGADVVGMDGSTLFTLAWNKSKVSGKLGIVRLLIQAGADVNGADINGEMHRAAHDNNMKRMKLLIETGADPNIANARGQTPLHSAAWSSSVDVVNALLAAGSDPLHRDNRGRTPLQYLYKGHDVFSAKHFKIMTTLVAAGDRSWRCVPTPCRGLKRAMLSVWQAAPDELPRLVKRMKNPPQNLAELVPRMNKDMKKVVKEVRRVLDHHFAGFPELKEHLLNSIFGFTTV